MRTIRKILWVVAVILAIYIGAYPVQYILHGSSFGLLSMKGDLLTSNSPWKICFYTHLLTGGVALLIGWVQFSSKLRSKSIKTHRAIGKIYLTSVMISSLTAIYIGFYATGGIITITGMVLIGCIWFYTTLRGYLLIMQGNLFGHQKMMIYSYAACFGGVTLRFWLPLSALILGDFVKAYNIAAWMSWIPNLAVAYFITRRIKNPTAKIPTNQ